MSDIIGKTLGRYHVIEQLGEGGMASVYKAFDSTLERHVAIKVIRTEKGRDEDFLRRFQREAKALAKLDHPYILKVLDYGEQEGMPYLVMPFVPGGTLKSKLGRGLPYDKAAAILAPVARALEYAHSQNIIHRDVKPANILLGQSETPLLSDFGVAKMLETKGETQLTGTGVGIGTPDYMAPEQWTGKADSRTDIYALGIVFYELIAGRRPYMADTPAAVLIKHVQEPLPRPKTFVPGLPDAVEMVIFKALAKNPADRYAAMGQYAEALEKLSRREIPTEKIDMAALAQAETLTHAVTGPTYLPGTIQSQSAAPAGVKAPKSKTGWLIGILAAGLVVVCVLVLGAVLGARFLFGDSGDVIPTPSESTQIAVGETVVSSEEETPQGGEATPVVTQEEPTEQPSLTPVPSPTIIPSKAPLTSIEGLDPDIPLLPDNNGDLITQEGEGYRMYLYSTNLPFEDVVTFYQSEMLNQGWELINTTKMDQEGTKMTMFTYQKGEDRIVMVNIYEQEDYRFIQLMPQDMSTE